MNLSPLQLFAIEFVTFAIEFVPFAIEFIGFAIKFISFMINFVSVALYLHKDSSITRSAATVNMKKRCTGSSFFMQYYCCTKLHIKQ